MMYRHELVLLYLFLTLCDYLFCRHAKTESPESQLFQESRAIDQGLLRSRVFEFGCVKRSGLGQILFRETLGDGPQRHNYGVYTVGYDLCYLLRRILRLFFPAS